jgi:hypothetical protein
MLRTPQRDPGHSCSKVFESPLPQNQKSDGLTRTRKGDRIIQNINKKASVNNPGPQQSNQRTTNAAAPVHSFFFGRIF